MIQEYTKNKRYQILTPHGWENFKGVIKNIDANKDAVTIKCGEFSLTATLKHRIKTPNGWVEAGNLRLTDLVCTEIGDLPIEKIEEKKLKDSYDIFDTDTHEVIVCGINAHQCDEFAFVANNKQKDFWTSISPTLATGGDCIITSTPKTDEDQFAQIWKSAIDNTDEFGNVTDDGTGKNGFYALKVSWDKHPDRDEKWAKPQREMLGEAKFRQEYECVSADTRVTVSNLEDKPVPMAIGDLFHLLSMVEKGYSV